MEQLAIKGHKTRGKEVIEILEMLGGKNKYHFIGDEDEWFVLNGNIQRSDRLFAEKGFTLEEFLEKFPYKVGDKVQHKGSTSFGIVFEVEKMRWVDNETVYTIKRLCHWNDHHAVTAEGLQPYKEETMEEKGDKAKASNLIGEDYSGKRFGYKIPNGYEFDCIKNNEIILKPKQPQYPKTYEECCEIIGAQQNRHYFYTIRDKQDYPHEVGIMDSLDNLRQLLICRDAYWKIAGEQMGLGKPWDSTYGCGEWGYWIGYSINENKIYLQDSRILVNPILVFPTAEMRDAFYENFKELIEQCKELL